MAVVPSDHVIDDPEGFRETVRRAVPPALEGRLVTIGIPPDRPATGYGYLHTGRCRKGEVCTVDTFREKPDLKTAERYLDSGEYLWNAGMFIWRADTILEQFRIHLPQLARNLESLGAEPRPDPAAYGTLESVSIDFGVMEKAGDVAAVPALFEWNDIGDWPSSRVCGVGCGEVLAYGSSDVTVWNREKLTVLLGVSGISVVETDDVTLVMSDEYAQELREVVRDLEDRRPDLV
jgi:mannose-1-phosphate guanylyltransferase